MNDIVLAGQLLGEKTVINEFIAYLSLKDIIASGGSEIIQKRTIVILTYALCGFSNFSSKVPISKEICISIVLDDRQCGVHSLCNASFALVLYPQMAILFFASSLSILLRMVIFVIEYKTFNNFELLATSCIQFLLVGSRK